MNREERKERQRKRKGEKEMEREGEKERKKERKERRHACKGGFLLSFLFPSNVQSNFVFFLSSD